MLSTQATTEITAVYIGNIMAAWHAASPGQRARGRVWYPAAHEIAALIGGGSIPRGAGIIAALSANKRWDANITLARRCAAGHVSGHTAVALAKVRAIMAGARPEDVLPMRLKTGHFYRCIADPSDRGAVVIDRHAHDVAAGQRYGNRDRGLSNHNRYAALAGAYRLAARELGELPQIIQAVTWVRQTDLNNEITEETS
jgi:hypothetical protein